jgi:hypothetical protein
VSEGGVGASLNVQEDKRKEEVEVLMARQPTMSLPSKIARRSGRLGPYRESPRGGATDLAPAEKFLDVERPPRSQPRKRSELET